MRRSLTDNVNGTKTTNPKGCWGHGLAVSRLSASGGGWLDWDRTLHTCIRDLHTLTGKPNQYVHVICRLLLTT